MFIFKRHNSYFKTHTGKIYPANKYTLEFLDAATEDQYVGYLAQKSFPLFRLVTHITPFWSTFIVAYRFLTHAWLIEWCYFLPITTILYAPCSLWIGSQIMKHRSSRKYGGFNCIENTHDCHLDTWNGFIHLVTLFMSITPSPSWRPVCTPRRNQTSCTWIGW